MAYSEKIIQQVWENGRASSDLDANEWRKDQCGAWIERDQYEHTHSDFGWKIHSILPDDTHVEYLRPFQHQNGFNVSSGQVQCHMQADRTEISPTAHISQPRNKPV